jgi:hypothetical protein
MLVNLAQFLILDFCIYGNMLSSVKKDMDKAKELLECAVKLGNDALYFVLAVMAKDVNEKNANHHDYDELAVSYVRVHNFNTQKCMLDVVLEQYATEEEYKYSQAIQGCEKYI